MMSSITLFLLQLIFHFGFSTSELINFELATKTKEKLPKGCYYVVGLEVKCYRLSEEKYPRLPYASEACGNYSQLALPMTFSVWDQIWDDIILESNVAPQWFWLGGKVLSNTNYVVDNDGLPQELFQNITWENVQIDTPAFYDLCFRAKSASKFTWKWNTISCNYDGVYYCLCEFKLPGCDMTDLQSRIPNANIWPINKPHTKMKTNVTVIIECLKGYRLIGSSNVTCIGQNWTALPQCSAKCALPQKSPHAESTESFDDSALFEPGDTIVYRCDDGFHSSVNNNNTYFQITCQDGGSWSGVEEDCVSETNKLKLILIFKVINV